VRRLTRQPDLPASPDEQLGPPSLATAASSSFSRRDIHVSTCRCGRARRAARSRPHYGPPLAYAEDRLLVSGRDALVAYDLSSGREIARFDTPGTSADMVVLDDGDEQRTPPFEPAQDGSALFINATAGGATFLKPVGENGLPLIVPSDLDNTVSVTDTTSREMPRTFPVGAQPNRVAVFGASGASQPSGPMHALH
jgi:hypothetical protein